MEKRVETIVIVIESATSAFAKNAITLEAVPPETAPTSTIPTINSSDKLKSFDTKNANKGINKNCKTTVKAMILGRFNTLLKSSILSVIPIQNIIRIKSGIIQDLKPTTKLGCIYASSEKSTAHKGNSIEILFIISYPMFFIILQK